MGPPRQCQVCNEAPSKYKCPQCLVPYCSLVCFKKHKEVPCVKPVSAGDQSISPNKTLVDRPIFVGGQDEVLGNLQLEAIASSSEIRNTLNDEKLRKFISAVDSSQDPETELDKAMEDEAFGIFTSKVATDVCIINGDIYAPLPEVLSTADAEIDDEEVLDEVCWGDYP